MLWPRFLWLRGLGLLFLSAFLSLAFQIHGLIGPRGILPASELFEALGQPSLSSLWQVPSLLWLGSSNTALSLLVSVGVAASIQLALNVWRRGACAMWTVLLLSFVAAAQDFSSCESDVLLLEAGVH